MIHAALGFDPVETVKAALCRGLCSIIQPEFTGDPKRREWFRSRSVFRRPPQPRTRPNIHHPELRGLDRAEYRRKYQKWYQAQFIARGLNCRGKPRQRQHTFHPEFHNLPPGVGKRLYQRWYRAKLASAGLNSNGKPLRRQ